MTSDVEPYERQGNEFLPGATVRLKGNTARTVSDTRFMVDDDGNPKLDDRGRPVRNPTGRKITEGDHSPDAPREGVVIGHEPPAGSHIERRHVLRMTNGQRVICDFVDLEEVSGPA